MSLDRQPPTEVATGRPVRTRRAEEADELVVEIAGDGHGFTEIKRCRDLGRDRGGVIDERR